MEAGKRKGIGAAWAVALALAAIGCGGGGGGGSTRETPTTGGVIGGGSSGGGGGDPLPSTTGGGSTSGSTGSEPSTTGGGATGGSETAGSATGGETTAGGTGGDPTGGGSETGGATSGTAGETAGGGGTTGGGGYPGGALRADSIYFGHWGDRSAVSSIRPDGSGREDSVGGAGDVVAAVPDPDHAGWSVYAAYHGGGIGVYRGASFDPGASVQLASPVYDFVSALQATADGAVVVVGGRNGGMRADLLDGGTTRAIDEADGAAVSLDGTKIAYTKMVDGADALYLWDRATGAAHPVAPGYAAALPSFSKDGSTLVFSSDHGGASWDLYQVPTAGGAVERLTDTPDRDEYGASYDEARTRVAYVVQSRDGTADGVYVLSNAGAARIATDADVSFATYWTTLSGRSLRGAPRGARFQRLPRRR